MNYFYDFLYGFISFSHILSNPTGIKETDSFLFGCLVR